jgi:hypothetical protein
MHLWNVGLLQRDYMALHPKRCHHLPLGRLCCTKITSTATVLVPVSSSISPSAIIRYSCFIKNCTGSQIIFYWKKPLIYLIYSIFRDLNHMTNVAC